MHVDSQLSSLLFSLLDHYQVIELNGVGIIELHHISAELTESDDKNQSASVAPPHLDFRFTADDKVSSNSLLKARSDSWLSDDDYNLLLTFVNKLNKEGQTNITIVIKSTASAGIYLPTLHLKEHTAADAASESPTTEAVAQPVSKLQGSEVEASIAEAESELKQQVHTPKPYKDAISVSTEARGWMNYIVPLLLLVAGIIGMTVLYKQCSSHPPAVPTEQVNSKALTRAEDDINPLTIDESIKIFDNPRLEKYRHVLTQDIIEDGCKITVGSFRDKDNAINMMERVLTEGYYSEIVSFDEGSRVIITFDCLSQDLDEYLTKVKDNIAPNAWYLQPKYEPEID